MSYLIVKFNVETGEIKKWAIIQERPELREDEALFDTSEYSFRDLQGMKIDTETKELIEDPDFRSIAHIRRDFIELPNTSDGEELLMEMFMLAFGDELMKQEADERTHAPGLSKRRGWQDNPGRGVAKGRGDDNSDQGNGGNK